jgi:hypothetical protein
MTESDRATGESARRAISLSLSFALLSAGVLAPAASAEPDDTRGCVRRFDGLIEGYSKAQGDFHQDAYAFRHDIFEPLRGAD